MDPAIFDSDIFITPLLWHLGSWSSLSPVKTYPLFTRLFGACSLESLKAQPLHRPGLRTRARLSTHTRGPFGPVSIGASLCPSEAYLGPGPALRSISSKSTEDICRLQMATHPVDFDSSSPDQPQTPLLPKSRPSPRQKMNFHKVLRWLGVVLLFVIVAKVLLLSFPKRQHRLSITHDFGIGFDLSPSYAYV